MNLRKRHALLYPSRRQLIGGGLGATASSVLGCTQFSPFEVDLPDDESDINAKQLDILAARPWPSGPWKFAVVSDTHLGYGNLEATVNALNGRSDIEFVVVGGDISDLGLREEYRTTLSILKSLRVPFLTALGNHDAISNGKHLFLAMFGPYDFKFEWGSLRFVFYNNNKYEFDDEIPDMVSLGQTLSAHTDSAGTVVVAHIPPTKEQQQQLADHGVIASIGGHIHRTLLTTDPIPMFTAPHGALGRYAIVSVSDRKLTFEYCDKTSCRRVQA